MWDMAKPETGSKFAAKFGMPMALDLPKMVAILQNEYDIITPSAITQFAYNLVDQITCQWQWKGRN